MQTPLWKRIFVWAVCALGLLLAVPNFFYSRVEQHNGKTRGRGREPHGFRGRGQGTEEIGSAGPGAVRHPSRGAASQVWIAIGQREERSAHFGDIGMRKTHRHAGRENTRPRQHLGKIRIERRRRLARGVLA